ncbi:pyridoxamine 5'-phosphate oxidase family protein [Methanobrevibacter sp. TMH8]|uniref:pyridoxamine 5'-phosphate oxidase family protein n=1 Tax=Methanobrevibacter sp. TMH8 TaxID=2848611 RepID=UPI001CCA1CA1|nr:pyridoxamine 5'-phosphate oxidase family protein [Methanobrevibacter sp. TMH8]MBZ9571705.1 pyridoxamine 5'-phosphate oxidase family protein [Methanobrevibacter sp. TMH8]
MRKKDREITDISEIIKIMNKCDICRIGIFDEEYPYIIPLNFGYNYKDGQLFLYFHSAIEGKKLDLIKRNNKIAFEMDCSKELKSGDIPCKYSMNYESICGNGIIEILNNKDKIKGLKYLMKNYSNKNYSDTDFEEKILKITTVLELKVDKIIGKSLKK